MFERSHCFKRSLSRLTAEASSLFVVMLMRRLTRIRAFGSWPKKVTMIVENESGFVIIVIKYKSCDNEESEYYAILSLIISKAPH